MGAFDSSRTVFGPEGVVVGQVSISARPVFGSVVAGFLVVLVFEALEAFCRAVVWSGFFNVVSAVTQRDGFYS